LVADFKEVCDWYFILPRYDFNFKVDTMLEIFNKYSKTQIERAQELIDNIESLDLNSSKEINGVEKIKGYDNLA